MEGRRADGRSTRESSATGALPLSAMVVQALEEAIHTLPPIQFSPANARIPFDLPPHYGGGEINRDEEKTVVRFSLRTLQGVLIGEIPFDQFAEDHELQIRVMRIAVKEGRQISGVAIQRCPEDDDDWVVFELSGTSPEKLLERRRT